MSNTHLPFVKAPPPPTLAHHDKTLEIILTALVGKELHKLGAKQKEHYSVAYFQNTELPLRAQTCRVNEANIKAATTHPHP